ncbi:3'(2'),5'-bisphosphate nucleotidase CysQ [Rhizobium binae]|uniref:3'(2'),5'-bisphosphate nucleotidase CysQ family protein n=1 Tax=Rhizobium binae TaxID=1138190 RepID=UPI001C83756B|nr:3'(2'),5'-bisphosphate nucleotidase CysQ [Rhizobium binae]MBX4952152.1 3'(2'),5'-bisphosphate nucleotidase CysQ [Rhizobium binae]
MDLRRRRHLIAEFIPLARRAGDAASALQHGGTRARTKVDMSPVTAADLASHQILRVGCRCLAPDIPVLSEEDTTLEFGALAAETVLLLDPLDGTKEFIDGRDDFTVNIALVEAGVPTAGLVYAPAGDRLFFSYGKQRAFTQALAATPRPLPQPPHPRPEPIVLVSRSHRDERTEQLLQALKPCEVRHLGSSLKFALVAAGEADIYLRPWPMMVWDCAAGQAIVEAAGGVVLGLDGSKVNYGPSEAGRVEGLVAARTTGLAARVLAASKNLRASLPAGDAHRLSPT